MDITHFLKTPQREGGLLRLLRSESLPRFNAERFHFTLRGSTSTPLKIHSDTSTKELDFCYSFMERLIKEACHRVASQGVPNRAVVHFYIFCEGMDQDFVWNAAGAKGLTVGELIHSKQAKEEVVDAFVRMIQSGKSPILNSRTDFQVLVVDPPEQYRKPPRYAYT